MLKQSEIWQHVKSGGLYLILNDEALLEGDLSAAVVYKSLWDGQVWVRPKAEFYDGRFRNVAVDEVTDCRPECDRSEEEGHHAQ